jgi:hypothetical protein
MHARLYTIAVLAAGTPLLLSAARTRAQEITVQGRVVERVSRDPVAAASVQLSGFREVLTSSSGAFVFSGVKPGKRTLFVNMIGYQRQQLQLDLRRDTSIVVELEVEAVRLKDVTVENERYSVRGVVKDRAHDRPIMDADILTSVRGSAARTNSIGRYRVSRLPVGPANTVQVRALGFLPITTTVDATRDTTINFLLEPDPVGVRMLQNQIDKLGSRAQAVAFSVKVYDRQYLLQQYYNFNLADIVTQLYQQMTSHHGLQCLFVDEQEQHFGIPQLVTYLPDEIERIEFIDRGTMVRIYTRRYMLRMIGGEQPGPIMLLKALGFGKTICK